MSTEQSHAGCTVLEQEHNGLREERPHVGPARNEEAAALGRRHLVRPVPGQYQPPSQLLCGGHAVAEQPRPLLLHQ